MGFSVLLIIVVVAFLVALWYWYDRGRYRGRRLPGQRPTGEVFRDPATGKLMRVYEDPVTGARDYREE